jgi:hypothetical protein
MSPQIEALAALVGFYSQRYLATFVTDLVHTLIPNELVRAFRDDQFRIVKLLLRFLNALVDYHLVTRESFGDLLINLSGFIESATHCRGEALARALIMTVQLSQDLNPDVISHVRGRVRAFIDTRPAPFVRRISTFDGPTRSFLDLLESASPLPIQLTQEYSPLFPVGLMPTAIPPIEFGWGEVDVAPFPLVMIVHPSVETAFSALLADIADDILVFFGLDIMVAYSQLAALPLLIGCPSLKALDSKKDSVVQIPDGSQFVVPLVATVVLSDLLRIPDSYYPPAFHTSLLQNFLTLRVAPSIEGLVSPVILDIVANIGGMDPGCYDRFVRFFSHHLSQWSFSWCWAEWESLKVSPETDTRRMFLVDLIRQCYFLGNIQDIRRQLEGRFDPILPPVPRENSKFDRLAQFEAIAQRLQEAMKAGPSAPVYDAVAQLKNKAEEFDVIQVVMCALFSNGKGEADLTITEIKKFSTLFNSLILKGELWRRQLLIQTAAEFYRDMPPVFQEVITFLVLNRWVSYSEFLQYFFDEREKVAARPGAWKLFGAVLNSVMMLYLTEDPPQVKGAQGLIKQVYTKASEFYARIALDAVAQRFFIGNLIDFGRRYYPILAGVREAITGLIMAGTVKPGMKKIIETITAFE